MNEKHPSTFCPAANQPKRSKFSIDYIREKTMFRYAECSNTVTLNSKVIYCHGNKNVNCLFDKKLHNITVKPRVKLSKRWAGLEKFPLDYDHY